MVAFGAEAATNHDAVGDGRALETPRREHGIGLAAGELMQIKNSGVVVGGGGARCMR